MDNIQMTATSTVARYVLTMMDSGVLWPDSNLNIRGTVVEVFPPRAHMLRTADLNRHAVVAAAFRERYPGGKADVSRTRATGGTKWHPLADRAEYRVSIEGVLVVLAYYVTHEHERYAGHIGTDGKPEWRCTGCRKRITVTESRRLGLLPPLVRKK
jgi:hypothetical protein